MHAAAAPAACRTQPSLPRRRGLCTGTTQITVAPASIHFGDIAVGSTIAAKNITITNHQSS